MKPLRAVAALAATAGLATAGILAAGGSSAPANVFVSPTGTDNASCSQTQPCRSFNAAFRAAKSGQTVELAGGTYPQQNIGRDASKTSAVTFRPADGATVTVGCNGAGQSCIDVYASHVAFDGGAGKNIKTQSYTANGFSYQGRIDTERGADDVAFLNLDVGAFTAAATHMQVVGNDLGPSVDPLNNLVVSDAVGVVITDNLIHDYVIVNGGHFECMYWQGVTNVTLAYNEFRSCAVYGIHSKEGDSFSSRGVTVDHNVFWNPRNLTTQADVQLTTEILPCSNSTVTNNVFTDGLINECSPTDEAGNVTRKQSDPPPVSPIRTGTPAPPPVTTVVTTTAPPPPPPPPGYTPACEPTCDEQIADLNGKVAAANDRADGLQARIDKATAALQP